MAAKSLKIESIQIKRATAAVWAALNPILNEGEFGYDKTNKITKIGDGVTAWNDLPSGGSSVDVDEISIIFNEYNELEVRGITTEEDSPRTLTFLPITKAEYSALSIKDPDTIYYITDDNEDVVAVDVTTSINGNLISNIFESNGTTAKEATHAASADEAIKATQDGDGNTISSTYSKNKIHNGTDDPASSLGDNGDIYIKYTASSSASYGGSK